MTDAKKRKSIYDRIPKEVVTNASTLARDLHWRAKQMLASVKSGEEDEASGGAVALASEADRGSKRSRAQSNGASRARGHKRPRVKNVLDS